MTKQTKTGQAPDQPASSQTGAAAEYSHDERLEIAIGHLLRAGVLLASATVLVGGVLFLLHQHAAHANYQVFRRESGNLRHPGTLLHALAQGDAAAIIQLGILLLMATPVARVVFSVAGFLLERDWLYSAVSFFVLAVLAFSLIWGH